MHNYEKENAKEWQMDLGETSEPKQEPIPLQSLDEGPEDDGWTKVVSSRPVPKKRFDAGSSKAVTPSPPTSRPWTMKPPVTGGHNAPMRGPDQAATTPRRPAASVKDGTASVPSRTVLEPRSWPPKPKDNSHLSSRKDTARSRYPTGVILPRKEDNAAKGAFRRGRPHDATFTLSKTCEKIEPDRIKMYSRLEEIGVRFESFIRPPQFLADRTLLLWGNEQQISQTIMELKEWVSSSDDVSTGPREKLQLKSKSENFPKLGLLQGRREEHLDKKLREEARMHKFQKNPEDGQEFAFQGYFLWPIEEVRPDDLLGPSCEAYDPIRTYNHSHIIFEPNLSSFKVLSNKEAAVQNALQRIEGTMREYVARSGKLYCSHMVQLPGVPNASKDVKMLAGSAGKIPLLTGGTITGKGVEEYLALKKRTDSSNHKRMRHALRRIVLRLPFYRGQVRMRVVFGTFTLSTFRWPGQAATVPLSEFIENIDVTSTKGVLLRDLQCVWEAERLFERCSRTEGLFESINTMYQYDRLEELQPVYTGRYRFQSPNTGNVVLEVEFSRVSGGQGIYETTRSQWIKDDPMEESVPLELNMMQLNGGSSWRLHVTSENIVDDSRVTPQMADFASSVTYRPPPPGTRPEVTGYNVFKAVSNLRYDSFEQKTAVQFCHKLRGNWTFEIARYDAFVGNITTASGKTQWGASYWNVEWDNTLGANLSLGIGQAATWNPWFKTFFPTNPRTSNTRRDVGFRDFIEDVEHITSMLDEMKGMTKDEEQ